MPYHMCAGMRDPHAAAAWRFASSPFALVQQAWDQFTHAVWRWLHGPYIYMQVSMSHSLSHCIPLVITSGTSVCLTCDCRDAVNAVSMLLLQVLERSAVVWWAGHWSAKNSDMQFNFPDYTRNIWNIVSDISDVLARVLTWMVADCSNIVFPCYVISQKFRNRTGPNAHRCQLTGYFDFKLMARIALVVLISWIQSY